MKTKRIAMLLLVLALMVSFYTPVSLAVSEADPVGAEAVANESLRSYYNSKIKPEMDNIGNNMTKYFSSQSEMKNAFAKAKTAIGKLKTAVNKKSKFKKDKKLQKYIKTMNTYIKKGHKRAGKVGSSDTTIMKYQKKVAKALKSFKTRINKLI